MGRLRLNLRHIRASKAVVALGGTVMTAGVWVNWGVGWALIAAGILAIAYGWLLIDVDQEVP